MTRSDQLIIKLEFDKSIRYLDKRGEKLTKGEILQKFGAMRMFIANMPTKGKRNHGNNTI